MTCRVDNDCFLGHICLHNLCLYGCRSDDDCSASESCRGNVCVNPCSETSCGINAVCTASNQRAVCSCPNGLVPAPTASVACVRAPPATCASNRQCSEGTVCIENSCRPFCASDAGCLRNEKCDSNVCIPVCRKDDDCRSGEVCDQLICTQGCRSDSSCPADKACINSKCAGRIKCTKLCKPRIAPHLSGCLSNFDFCLFQIHVNRLQPVAQTLNVQSKIIRNSAHARQV